VTHAATPMPRRARAAFTLLEVMVAVAILALALSAIFSSEAGAARMAHTSRKMGIAALLARCKMGEIEEQVAEEGLPAVFASDTDACCEDAEVEGFECKWEINPIVLPETMFAPEDEESGPLGSAAATDDEGDSSPMDPASMLSGDALGGIGSLAMQYAFPVLKPSIESQIRRATVTVSWKEGDVDHSMDVTQFLVSEEPVQLDLEGIEAGATQGATEGEASGVE